MKLTNQAVNAIPSNPRVVLDISGEPASAPLSTAVQSVGDARYILSSAVSSFIMALFDDTDGGTAFATLGVTKSLVANGYYRFPSGIMIQWGSTFNAASDFATAFPVAFPTACVGVFQNPNFNTAVTTAYVINTSNVSASTFDTRCRAINTGGSVAGQANLPLYWLAIGY